MLSKPKKILGKKKSNPLKIAMNQKIKATPLESQTLGTSQTSEKRTPPKWYMNQVSKLIIDTWTKNARKFGFVLEISEKNTSQHEESFTKMLG